MRKSRTDMKQVNSRLVALEQHVNTNTITFHGEGIDYTITMSELDEILSTAGLSRLEAIANACYEDESYNEALDWLAEKAVALVEARDLK